MATVPYLFSDIPGGTSIPLAWLDADFAYLTDSPEFNNLHILGNLQVDGNETVNGNITGHSNLTIDGNGSFGGSLSVGGNLLLSGCLVFGGQTICTVTGTAGSMVLSNNPTINSPLLNNATLVAPALGTPISGNLVNCTGYPSSGLTGVVPIANGGTAATTAPVALYNLLPSQSGHTGEVLTTDGAGNVNWAPAAIFPGNVVPISNGGTSATTAPAALNNLLPSQAGQSGKVLTTDGAGNVTWVDNFFTIANVNVALRTTPVVTGVTVNVGGYYNTGDGGGGYFYGVTGGSFTDNGGTIITTGLGVTAGAAWIRVYQGALDVHYFGAYGNGVNDDTNAIQRTMAAANNTAVYFPTGTYIVSAQLTMPQGASIFGDGPAASILQPAANNFSIFSLTNTTSPLIVGPNINSLGFIIPVGSPVTGVNAIYINGASTAQRINLCTLSNIVVYASNVNAFANGIYLEYCANTHITDCRVTFANYGYVIHNCTDTNMSNCDAQLGNNIGFYIWGGAAGAFDEGMRISGCSTNGQYIGCYVLDQFWGEMTGCSFTTDPGGSLIFNGAGNWQVNSCEFSSTPGTGSATNPGISIINGSSNIAINGCFIAICTFGVNVQSSTSVIVSTTKFTANQDVDIYFFDSAQVSVTGNICESNVVPQSIVEAGTSNYNLTTNNIVNGTVIQVGPNSLFNNNLNY